VIPVRTSLGLVLASAILALAAGAGEPIQGGQTVNSGVHSFTMRTNDGREKALSDYRGQVLLIVNTASECGFTGQYAGLQELYQTYKDKGFAVLAFPANNFGGQEPGSDEQIRSFCSTKYRVTFDLFAKTSVKGADINPLYKYLTTGAGFDGDISWNFNKFLVDRRGKVVARFGSQTKPLSDKIVKEVERLLGEK
jgi:glutathione peroxidase